jgi:uncharacterized membrane protein
MRAIFLTLLCWLCPTLAVAQAPTSAPQENLATTNTTNNWNICNETSYVLRLASAYIRSDRLQTAGWSSIQPGACTAVVTPKNSPRFLFAESLPIHRGGVREWKGAVKLCATEDDFVSDATDNCQLKNMGTRNFFSVDPAEIRTALIEPNDFGETAEIAGLQRLLQDSGYKITRVDGLSGRRTIRTINEAKADLSLDKDATNQDLMAALIPAAKKARETVGLDICNDSTSRVYGAIAVQTDGNWTSRGWWPVEPGTCVKPYDRSLIGSQAHVFALQEAADENGETAPDRRLRSETVTPTQFCIAESRFAALGQENCLEQGYAAVAFRPVPTEADGQILRLTDADFVGGSADGLRR